MSLYLRIAAPQQSWGLARISGMVVPSAPTPTRSGIRGLVAAALGAERGQLPEWLDGISVEVRVDSPGSRSRDFQTITFDPNRNALFGDRIFLASTGKKATASSYLNPTSSGGAWNHGKKAKTAVIRNIPGEVKQTFTAIIKREIIEGATFMVEISHPTHQAEIDAAFSDPGFSPYLGRKAFSPTFPFVLGTGDAGLLDSMPTVVGKPSMRISEADSLERPRLSNLVEKVSTAGLLEWCSKNLTRA